MPKALAGSRLAMFNGLAVVILPQKPTWPFDTVHYPQYMVWPGNLQEFSSRAQYILFQILT